MKPPIYKGGGAIKGEPKSPTKNAIDRTKYSKALSNPVPGNDDVTGNDLTSFSPAVLQANGFKYHSGTMGGKDIAYEKNGNIYLYNEQPGSTDNKYRLTNIGNPFASQQPVTQQAQPIAQAQKPVIDPNRKPLDLSNPSLNYDPNTGKYFNNMTGAEIQPLSYKKGGLVSKMKGYLNGTTEQGVIRSDGTYANAIGNANAGTADAIEEDKKKKTANPQIRNIANTAGSALGAYGTGYYASQDADNTGDNVRNKALGAAGAMGPIGGAISGIAGIGDQIGAPIKANAEKTDENGNLVDANKANRNAMIGGLLSPSKALAARSSYKGGWTDWSGQGYLKNIEKQAKDKLQAQRDEQVAQQGVVDNGRIAEAIARRDTGETGYNDNYIAPAMQAAPDYSTSSLAGKTNIYQKYTQGSWSDKRKRLFGRDQGLLTGALKGKKEGGLIEGPGTAKSDSIKAVIKPGSFVVPAENAELAEELRAKVLMKAPKAKAKLNQQGGTGVKLSDGEHLFDPKEKMQLMQAGVNLKALAPNAEAPYSDGGADDVPHAQRATPWGGMKGGGDVPKKKPAPAPKKKLEDMSNDELDDEILKRENNIGSEISPERKKAHRKQIHGELGQKISNHKATPQEIQFYNQLSKEFGPSTYKKAPVVGNRNATGTTKSAAPQNADFNFATWDKNFAKANPGPEDVTMTPPASSANKTTANTSGPNPNQEIFDRDWDTATTPDSTTSNNNSGFDYGKIIDYGIPAVQAGLGLKYLRDAGKRPVDQLDPDYLRSIDTARANVVTANANAKYGFSPEEQAQINIQNQNLTNAGRYSARNLTGGSSASALGLERSVLNDSFGRDLSAKVQNKNLIFQKQQTANDRQQYLDSLITNKVGMSNRLFNLKLDAWNTQQQTGAGLLGAAAANAIGAHQWNQELEASKKRQAMYNPQYPTI